MPGVYLENLTWKEAEACLTEDAVVVIPLGAALKEHGLHLKLNNDKLIAEYLGGRVAETLDVIILPTLIYSYYPAFVEYPGSVNLSEETSAATVVEIVRSLAAFGPRRFYVINTGVSTAVPLGKAKAVLEKEGLSFRFTDFRKAAEEAAYGLTEQEGGGHADEVETSLMLAIAPDTVTMDVARPDYTKGGSGPLTRLKSQAEAGKGVYSATGAWGNPALASRKKGITIAERLTEYVIRDLRSGFDQ